MGYCLGCNERFSHLHNNGLCPRCGALIDSVDDSRSLNKTLLIRDNGLNRPNASDPLSDVPEHPDDEDLAGADLHVYSCESLLGRGGMGRVYLARHNDLGRFCALKVLSSQVLSREIDWVERFREEGRAAAGLSHPNIVTTHAIGQSDGLHFLEMEFVAGRSMQNLIDDEGHLTPARATRMMIQVTDGLAMAHKNDIVHRDVKPDNVLLNQKGIAKIGDFGLAKRVAANGNQSSEPLFGTPYFMAPELFQGGRSTTTSDVYALGVCYFLLLTGQLPFVSSSFKELRQRVTEERIPQIRKEFPHIPLEMTECLSLLLAKSPTVRPQDAIEAFQLLTAVAGQVRDVESLLREAFPPGSNITWIRCGRFYCLDVVLPDERRQKVFVEPSDHSSVDRLLLIYSVCCRAEPSFYEAALKLNSELSHGSISVREVEGEQKFVMGDAYPRSTVDVEEIRRSVLEIASHADAVEQQLTGSDRN